MPRCKDCGGSGVVNAVTRMSPEMYYAYAAVGGCLETRPCRCVERGKMAVAEGPRLALANAGHVDVADG